MRGVSSRTLILLLELLVAVVAFQFLSAVRSAQAGAVWLADDCVVIAPASCGAMKCATDSESPPQNR
jgi:hypothetical protein